MSDIISFNISVPAHEYLLLPSLLSLALCTHVKHACIFQILLQHFIMSIGTTCHCLKSQIFNTIQRIVMGLLFIICAFSQLWRNAGDNTWSQFALPGRVGRVCHHLSQLLCLLSQKKGCVQRFSGKCYSQDYNGHRT